MPFRSIPASLRLRRIALWVLAASPALLTLGFILPLRSVTPHADAWAIVEQYRAWLEGNYGWRDLFKLHNQHPSAVGKLLYFAVLHWGRGEVALLPLLTWGLSAVVSVSFLGLLRWCRVVTAAWLPAAWLAGNLMIFSLAQGNVWTWEFLVFNAIPGACLALGLAALGAPGGRGFVFLTALAAALSLAALFSFGSGFLVAFLLLPAWLLRAQASPRMKGRRLILAGAVWVAVMSVMTLLALGVIGPVAPPAAPAPEGRLQALLAEPGRTAQFLLILAGRGWGQGSSLDPVTQSAWAGAACVAAGLAALLALVRCGGVSADLLRRLWPWLAFAGYGGANALLICWGRMAGSMVAALDARYIALTAFLGLAVLGLLLLAQRRLEETGRWPRWRRAGSAAALPALAALAVVSAYAWADGCQGLRAEHQRMQALRGSLAFAKILPLDRFVFWGGLSQVDGAGELALFLHEHRRLRGVDLLESAEVAAAKVLSPVAAAKGRLISLEVLADGSWLVRGYCAWDGGWDTRPALVALSFASEGSAESWVALGAHHMLDDFFHNEWMRLRQREHYFGWQCRVPAELAARLGRGVLRAYGYDADRHAFRSIPGSLSMADLPAAPALRPAGES